MGELADMVSAFTAPSPPTLEIRARHSDPNTAALVADIVARDFMDFVVEQRLAEIARVQSAAVAQGLASATDLVSAQLSAIDSLELLEPVTVPGSPILPNTRQNVLLGVLLGIVSGTGIALLLGSLSDTVRDPDEISRRFGINTLGTIFKWSDQEVNESEMMLSKHPVSGFSESLRQTRANIQFATANLDRQVLMVSSPGPGEGKSTMVSNLAVALAQAGRQVIVLDGDLRRPSVHRRFQPGHREPGLSNFLSDPDVKLKDILQESGVEGVQIVAGGPIPPNPSELLGSRRMSAIIEETSELADTVFVDTPPVLVVSDSAIIASQVNGAIIVVDGYTTKSSSLKATLDTLGLSEVHVVGCIINKLKRSRFGVAYGQPYYYNNSYDYYRYGGYGEVTDRALASTNGKTPAFSRPLSWVKSVIGRRTARKG